MEKLRNIDFAEVMLGMRSNSEIMILDFDQISENTPDYANIKTFFVESYTVGLNPRTPELRQKFNENFLNTIGKKYLIGRYGEDRKQMLIGTNIEKEGRTIHLGLDIYSKNLDEVCSPMDGEIVRVSREYGEASYGYYVIIKHEVENLVWYSFYGHMSKELPILGRIKKGERIGRLGDFIDNENGGWSRHLHFQILKDLPDENETPIGYSSKEALEENKAKFTNPNIVLKLKE